MHETLIIVIGVVIIAAVGTAIFKGYSATGVLLVGGIVLLAATLLLQGGILPSDKSSGIGVLDIFEVLKKAIANRAGGLGLTIMTLCGFAAYMSEIGANNVVVKLASKPLHYIKSPYILMTMAYIIACLMSLAVTSATGLGVLLMATLFPVMTRMGISVGAATSICAMPAAIILSPTSSDVIVAAKASGMHVVDFAFKACLPVSLVAIVTIAISNILWQRYCDKKEGFVSAPTSTGSIEASAPWYYFFFPFLPIVGVIFFSGKFSGLPSLHIITIVLISIFIAAVVEYIRSFDGRRVLDGLTICYKAMGEAFAGVVMLLIAAGIFASGLKQVGFISTLLGFATSGGTGAIGLMVLLVVITFLAVIATGSGNAPFYAFVELIPNLAATLGISSAFLVIPMLQASNLARTMSPVSGVVVATSGIAKISPLVVVKRTSVPMLVGALTVMIATVFIVPMG